MKENRPYLEEPIPACTYQPDPGINPCPVRASSYPNITSTEELGELPTYTEILLGGSLRTPSFVTHIVIRGTVLPNSTRCEIYPLSRFNFSNATGGVGSSYWYLCFVEVAVTEYIVGTGPPILTVNIHHYGHYGGLLIKRTKGDGTFQWEQVTSHDYDFSIIEEVSEPQSPKDDIVNIYEGKELILFLGIPITKGVETWSASDANLSLWFLGRNHKVWAMQTYYYGEVGRSMLLLPLADLVTKIKQADAERDLITGGRLIVTPDNTASNEDDPNTIQPMVVTDAHNLKDLYLASGAVYEGDDKTVLPPPPPDGFVPPPTTVVASTTTSSTSATSVSATTRADDT